MIKSIGSCELLPHSLGGQQGNPQEGQSQSHSLVRSLTACWPWALGSPDLLSQANTTVWSPRHFSGLSSFKLPDNGIFMFITPKEYFSVHTEHFCSLVLWERYCELLQALEGLPVSAGGSSRCEISSAEQSLRSRALHLWPVSSPFTSQCESASAALPDPGCCNEVSCIILILHRAPAYSKHSYILFIELTVKSKPLCYLKKKKWVFRMRQYGLEKPPVLALDFAYL